MTGCLAEAQHVVTTPSELDHTASSGSFSALRPGFFALCVRRDVVIRALKTSALVGTILTIINHSDAILAGSLSSQRALRIALTYCVPYAVATYASVQAIRGERVRKG